VNTRISGSRLTVDIDFRSAKVAVFVDGCYWHGCPDHPRTPTRGPNKSAWDAKFRSVAEREDRAGRLLSNERYAVVRVRECRIKANPASVAGEIATIVRIRLNTEPAHRSARM
jgi:DNA mismatch endonuclease, patch repair protein